MGNVHYKLQVRNFVFPVECGNRDIFYLKIEILNLLLYRLGNDAHSEKVHNKIALDLILKKMREFKFEG